MYGVLQKADIRPQKVVKKRRTGYYTAEFFVPGMEEPIAPSATHAARLQAQFPERVRIIQTRDTTADWRPGKPVIWATVTFEINDTPDS